MTDTPSEVSTAPAPAEEPSMDGTATDEQATQAPAPPKAEAGVAPSTSTRPMGPMRALGWLFVFVMAAVLLGTGALIMKLLAPPTPPAPIESRIEPTADVVRAVQDLARLETARVHTERVVDLRDRQSTLFGLVDAEDAILLVAAADVSAGVDLTQMTDGDVIIEPDRHAATVRLPAPEIFDARLDNDRTYVHSRQTDRLADRSAHLETRARRQAEQNLEQSAIDAGLLERARRNARITIEALLHSLGFEEVRVEFADTADGPLDGPRLELGGASASPNGE